MLRYIITPLLFCCLITPVAADEIQLQDNHPERYVVVKGDTLWGISAKFLKDPWQWPKVWKMNREQIKNPHWIYPGDVVVLDTSSGQPELKLLRETITLDPSVIEEPLPKKIAIPTIQPNVIAPFLAQPLVVENDDLATSPSILAGPENRVAYVAGNKIYSSQIDQGSSFSWHVYRPGKLLVDPESGETLGIEAVYLGDARIAKFGSPATLDLVSSREEIYRNDKLIPSADALMSSYAPHAPEADIKGRIMTIYGGVAEAGNNAIVSINKGTRDGLEDGNVLGIFRAGKFVSKDPKQKAYTEKFPMKELRYTDTEAQETVKKQKVPSATVIDKEAKQDPNLIQLPNERVGLLMIFRVFDKVAYGIILQATQPINVLDIVQTP